MNGILKGSDYEKIEEEANELIEALGLNVFPLNCFEVAAKLNIKLKSYADITDEEDRKFVESKLADGCSTLKANGYIIFYNEQQDKNRIKFTIWHELAHIQLGHIEPGCIVPYNVQEMQANHFASYLIAPIAFIHRLGLTNPCEIARIFEISFECACNAFMHYKNAFKYRSVKNAILNGRINQLLTYINKEVTA